MSSLKGSFRRVISARAAGLPVYSFELRNTAWLRSVTVDLLISDASGLKPWYFRETVIKAGHSVIFNPDTCGWDWAQGDFCALLGKNDRMESKWELRLKVYAPGECPECHGTHKCSHCRGEGYSFNTRTVEITRCPYCGGTGVCQTCYIPERGFNATAPAGSHT